MRQSWRGVKAEVAKRPVAGRSRKPEDTELSALKKRLAEALEQQTATSEILRVISSSPNDVQPVFDTIAERAATLCGARFAFVTSFDGEWIHMRATYGPGAEAHRPGYPIRPGPGAVAARVIRDRTTVQIEDMQADQGYAHKEAAARQGFQSAVGVPMMRDGQILGCITVARPEIGAVPETLVRLLQTFADQAVIAIENVRLFSETKEALERQMATSEVLEAISGAQTDASPVFETIARNAHRLSGAVRCNVLRYDGRLLNIAACYGFSPEDEQQLRKRYPVEPGDASVMSGRVILSGRVEQMDDVLRDPLYDQEHAVTLGLRRMLGVPMLRDGVVLGVIVLAWRESGQTPAALIALLQTFAAQAVIAIENVRLFNETKEALERQTATSDILRVISQSPRDVQPVFDTIAAAALKLCNASSANVFTFDGELIHLAAFVNVDPGYVGAMHRHYPRPPGRDTGAARAIQTCSVVEIPDVKADREYAQVFATRSGAGAFRSVLAVPLMRDGSPIGAIAVGRPEAGPFRDSQIALLKTFADQALIAIENVRLFTQLETRTLQLTRSVGELKALGEVGQAVSSTLDLETVLSTIVSRAVQLAGMDGGSIWEYDERREEFYVRATHRLPDEQVELHRATPIRQGEGALGQLAMTPEPIEIRDVADEPGYPTCLRETLIRSGYRSVLAVPLLREDHLLGALAVNRTTPGAFAPEVVALLKTFATQSALAIQNARLYREIEVKSHELEAASRHKSEFLANMSHELRTPLNAIIGFSEVLSERMFGEINEKQAEYIGDILQSGQHLLSLINDILDLSKIEAGRMELEFRDFNLPSSIEQTVMLVRERAVRRGITLGRTIDERLGSIRADERKVKQVLLNLLSNALKFTPEGGTVDVRATVNDGVAEISVTDTGIGISPEDQEAVFEEFRQVGTASKKVEGTGLGLAISKKFIELHGGKIWVTSQVGTGSTFTFTLPLQEISA